MTFVVFQIVVGTDYKSALSGEDEKNALIKIINSMLTKKRMKDLLDGKVNF